MMEVNQCPICNSRSFTELLTCKDYTVSQESFIVKKCTVCKLGITSPRPSDEDLGRYYESEAYISHANTRKSLFDRIYQTARRYTTQWKIDIIKEYNPVPNIKLLDYGCGTGHFLHQASTTGIRIDGLEPNDKARKQAEALLSKHIFKNIGELTSRYDVITLWHVLEHIPNFPTIVHQLHKSLNTNGMLFVAVPNMRSADADRYQQFWAAYDVPRHLWHFNKDNMKMFLESFGFDFVGIAPMKLDAFYVSMLSEKYKTGKLGLSTAIKGTIHGFLSNRKAATTSEHSSLIYIARKK